MNRKSKKRLRGIISTILSFLLAVLFTVGSVLVGLYIGFLNENRIIDGLNYKDYYSGVEENFYQNSKDITTPMGLPENVVDGIVDSETIYENIKDYVVAAVNGQTYVFATEDLKTKLEQNVRNYFTSQGWEITSEQEATIPQYTQMIADEYVSCVKVPFVEHFAAVKRIFQKILLIGIPAIVILSAIIIFMLVHMQKWKHRGVRYVVYSSFATMIMVAVPGIAALVSGFYKKINISTEYLYYALVKYISNGLWVFIYLAFVWFAISLALLFLIRFIKKYRN